MLSVNVPETSIADVPAASLNAVTNSYEFAEPFDIKYLFAVPTADKPVPPFATGVTPVMSAVISTFAYAKEPEPFTLRTVEFAPFANSETVPSPSVVMIEFCEKEEMFVPKPPLAAATVPDKSDAAKADAEKLVPSDLKY